MPNATPTNGQTSRNGNGHATNGHSNGHPPDGRALLADRLPPQNRDAERSVLGSMLRDNGTIADMAGVLTPADFYHDAHQTIFAAIRDQWDRRKPSDLVTLADALHVAGQLDDCGRAAYLAELWDAAPTAANAQHYAGIVRDKALLRHLIHLATATLRDAYDQRGPAEELLAALEQQVFALHHLGSAGQATLLAETLPEALERIEARGRGDIAPGLPTGLVDLDRLTAGLQPGELVLVGARPSVGKSSIALSVALNVALRGVPVYYAALEQSRAELAERLLAMLAAVDSHQLRTGKLSAEDADRLIAASNQLRRVPLWIDDQAEQTCYHIVANARRFHARKPLGLVVVDYVQLLTPTDRKATRNDQIGEMTRGLKRLARELSLPVLVPCQINREGADKPKLQHLRESGSLEADADVVWLLHREACPQTTMAPVLTVQLDVAKNRNGRTGELDLGFEKRFVRFVNLAADPFPREVAP